MTYASNTTSTLRLSADGATMAEARCADMAALEALPAPLRIMLWEHNTNISASSVVAYFASMCRQCNSRDQAIDVTARKLRAIESADIAAFRVGGQPTLHVAAGASVLRYHDRKVRP